MNRPPRPVGPSARAQILVPGAILFLANAIAVTSLFAGNQLELPDWCFWGTSCWSAIALGQGTILAIVAALAPVRHCLRLPMLAAGIVVQAASVSTVAILTESSTWYYPYAFLAIAALLAATLFVLYMPLRFLLAVRLDIEGGSRPLAPLQFSIGDLLEWSTALAVLMGLLRWWVSIVGPDRLHVPGTIALHVAVALCYGIPILSLILGERRARFRGVVVVFWLAFAMVIHMGLVRMTSGPHPGAYHWEDGLLPDAAFIATLAANALVLRWLGFRFAWGQVRVHGDPPALKTPVPTYTSTGRSLVSQS